MRLLQQPHSVSSVGEEKRFSKKQIRETNQCFFGLIIFYRVVKKEENVG